MRTRWVLYSSLVIAFLFVGGLGCRGGSKEAVAAAKPVTLEYWSTIHDSRLMDEFITKYRATHQQIRIRYRRLRPEEFEQQLLEALAEDRGPDIISIHNSWIGKYQTKLLPAPPTVQVAQVYTQKGAIRTEQITQIATTELPSLQQMERLFVPAVVGDVIRADEKGKPQILGLPMTLDTMVLFYNQDLLDQAGVPQAPSSWAELQEAVVAATRYDSAGNIVQAGGAFGAGKNVDRAGDILTALILQNGATMADARGRAVFNLIGEGQSPDTSPAIEALRFYTDFGNPTKQVYTWNAQMESSFDAFARGKATFFFGYSYHIPLLKARAPKLNYRILQMPQLDPNKPKNVANYWVEAISKKTKSSNEAWDFVSFITRAEQADAYAERTRKPTALRASIDKQLQNPDLAPFAAQVLSAQSWYRGRSPEAADSALAEMIDYIHENRALEESGDLFGVTVNRAASKINQSL